MKNEISRQREWWTDGKFYCEVQWFSKDLNLDNDVSRLD